MEQDSWKMRYGILVELWTHHSSSQLQWPAIVITAAILASSVALGVADPNNVTSIVDVDRWGNDLKTDGRPGLPLTLAAVATLTIS